jgi:regulator of sigma E protease
MGVVVLLVMLQLGSCLGIAIAALVAKACGFRVDRVSVGFGRALVVIGDETRWQLGLLPVVGFIQLAGRDASDRVINTDDPRAFFNRPVWLRVLPSLSLPLGFTLLAMLLMSTAFLRDGVPVESQRVQMANVLRDSPAAAAGILAGDEVVAVNGQPTNLAAFKNDIQNAATKSIRVTVVRDQISSEHEVTPRIEDGKRRIGVELVPVEVREHVGLGKAVAAGVAWPFTFAEKIFEGFSAIISGSSVAQFSGPIGIFRIAQRQPDRSHTIVLVATICCYWGLFSFLPIPPYPGGKALMILFGWRSRRRRVETQARSLGAITLSRGKLPKLLWPVAFVFAIFALAVSAFASWQANPFFGVVALVAIAPIYFAFVRGFARMWTILIYLVGVEALSNAVMQERSATKWISVTLLACSWAALYAPSIRAWFHHTCPACAKLGARPVWSLRNQFGCVHCGSSWSV